MDFRTASVRGILRLRTRQKYKAQTHIMMRAWTCEYMNYDALTKIIRVLYTRAYSASCIRA